MTCVVCRSERMWSTCAGHQTCDRCRRMQQNGSPRLQNLSEDSADDLQEIQLWTT